MNTEWRPLENEELEGIRGEILEHVSDCYRVHVDNELQYLVAEYQSLRAMWESSREGVTDAKTI